MHLYNFYNHNMEADDEELSYEHEVEREQLPEHYDDAVAEPKTYVFKYLGKTLWCQIAKSSCSHAKNAD